MIFLSCQAWLPLFVCLSVVVFCFFACFCNTYSILETIYRGFWNKSTARISIHLCQALTGCSNHSLSWSYSNQTQHSIWMPSFAYFAVLALTCSQRYAVQLSPSPLPVCPLIPSQPGFAAVPLPWSFLVHIPSLLVFLPSAVPLLTLFLLVFYQSALYSSQYISKPRHLNNNDSSHFLTAYSGTVWAMSSLPRLLVPSSPVSEAGTFTLALFYRIENYSQVQQHKV